MIYLLKMVILQFAAVKSPKGKSGMDNPII